MTITAVTIQNFKGIGEAAGTEEAVRVDLKPITLLFGANSAGKSSVLQAMLYVREVLARRNTNPDLTQLGGEFVDLGGFRNLIHNHDPSLRLTLQFDLDLSAVDLIDFVENAFGSGARKSQINVANEPTSSAVAESVAVDQLRVEAVPKAGDPLVADSLLDRLSADARTATISITVKWSELTDEPVQADYEVRINGEPAARIETDPSSGTSHVVKINLHHGWFYGAPDTDESVDTDDSDRDAQDWLELRPLEAGTYRAVRRPHETLFDEIRSVLSLFDLEEFPEAIPFALTAPGEYLLSQLNDLRYLGPVREVPSRTHLPALSPDLSRWANGLGAWDWIYLGSKEQLAELNSWLTREDRLSTGYRVDVKRFKELSVDSLLMLGLMDSADLLDNYQSIREELDALPVKTRIVLRQEADFLEVSPQDVGIGISQVIPVVVSALDGGDRMTVIEQPELHIHPAIQVALGDLFIEAIKPSDGGGTPRFIIETHSEHLLLRLLRRIRETADGSVQARLALAPESLGIYFVEASPQGTMIRAMPVDQNGNFAERWPRGFFEEREKEFFGDAAPISDEDLKKVLGK